MKKALIIVLLLLFLVACAKPAAKHESTATKPAEPKVTTPPAGTPSTQEQTAPSYDATLTDLSGDATVNGKPAALNMQIREGDVVATQNGQATVEFFDGAALRIDSTSEIVVRRLAADPKTVGITQNAGQTWTRVLKIAGLDSYQITTPNTVATIRGTGFMLTVNNESTDIGVGEGLVHLQNVENSTVLSEIDVSTESEVVVPRHHNPREKMHAMEQKAMHHNPWIDGNMKKDDDYITVHAHKFMEKNPHLAKELERHGLNQTNAAEWARKLAMGKLSQEETTYANDSIKELKGKGIHIPILENETAKNATKHEPAPHAPLRNQTRAHDTKPRLHRTDQNLNTTLYTQPVDTHNTTNSTLLLRTDIALAR